jgi:diguanylate cyclase (GGDEF)-like protein
MDEDEIMTNITNLLHTEESIYLGRVFTDIDQTLMVVGINQSIQSLAVTFGQTYNVIKANHNQEILKAAGNEDIDLILVDTAGDKELWIESLRQIRSSSLLNFIPVLVLSEKNSVNEQLIALELGALDSLLKPLNPFLLTAKISNYMKLMKNVRELELVSSTDGLTGLANRMQLDSTLLNEWHRMRRNKRPLSALMIDVDYFKLFNDKYGHLEGDECLKAVADVIKGVAGRDSDFSARFGGEEFVILLPFTEKSGAEKIAQTLLTKIDALKIPSASKQHKFLSVSIGVSSCQPHDIDAQDIEPSWLLEEADKNMYKAKQSGRNQYCS